MARRLNVWLRDGENGIGCLWADDRFSRYPRNVLRIDLKESETHFLLCQCCAIDWPAIV